MSTEDLLSDLTPETNPATGEFGDILRKLRRDSKTTAALGSKFENLIAAWLRTDGRYAALIEEVWTWNKFPFRRSISGHDTGIDLVARTSDGEYWAIQCKCFRADARMSKEHADSFISTSGRSFTDDFGKTTQFAHRLWVATSRNFGPEFERVIQGQTPPVSIVSLKELEDSNVNWSALYAGTFGKESRKAPNKPRPHQVEAIEAAHSYFAKPGNTRGKLIMACGTGKTFTALRIAEKETEGKGLVLCFVPSIALVSQMLREWATNTTVDMYPVCVCSDSEVSSVGKKDEDTFFERSENLALPATTDPQKVADRIAKAVNSRKKTLTVIFSTYQSSAVITDAQNIARARGNPFTFDLMICDEAHRTTGFSLPNEERSAFTKVHYDRFVAARRRIYMTATPRIYDEESTVKAENKRREAFEQAAKIAETDALIGAIAPKPKHTPDESLISSMDDERLYGKEIYRIGFGKAVEKGLLADYKVLVLTISEKDVPPEIQKMLADESGEIPADDFAKFVGSLNALSKQMLANGDLLVKTDPEPMRRAVAFCQSIKISKETSYRLNSLEKILENESDPKKAERNKSLVRLETKHVDGTMRAGERNELLDWLKADAHVDGNRPRCRVLCNVRCLSEGVDVPALDAALFLSARNSQIDIVQSVGRVMRRAEGKKYGYIIIPVVIPAGKDENDVLSHGTFDTVWAVLRALRAHDDRFCAVVNQIDLNKSRPKNILVGRGMVNPAESEELTGTLSPEKIQEELQTKYDENLNDKIYAKIVEKVGERTYWEEWAGDIGKIAERHTRILRRIVGIPSDTAAPDDAAPPLPAQKTEKIRNSINDFLKELRKNINPQISLEDVVDMLSQHIVSKPVFEALYADAKFVENNPISRAMTKILADIESFVAETVEEHKTLENFKKTVCARVEGIDNADGRQRIQNELYEKFFKVAAPKTVEKLGIVYTPIEVVDFIIHSVEFVLKKEFKRSLADKGIHILDPFTGTGTFISRLLRSGIIPPRRLRDKFLNEIHANEIVLLAYYVACINIEQAFAELSGAKGYTPFPGACLTDTFQMTEDKNSFVGKIFKENSAAVSAQKELPLRVIIGNPPYSVGQKSANDNAQNEHYEQLEHKIAETYAAKTEAGLKKALYDSYIKAFRWATDRLDPDAGGIIAYVTNGSWLNANAMNGFRKCLAKEFSAVYVFNLRGNCRTSGELRRREAGNVFGEGSRTPIAITLLVKRGNKDRHADKEAEIFYRDIGDYLTRAQKLKILTEAHSIDFKDGGKWTAITPDKHGDWLNKRSELFATFTPLEPEKKKKFDAETKSVFTDSSRGVATSRDAWCWNFSRERLAANMRRAIRFYNAEVDRVGELLAQNPNLKAGSLVERSSSKFSWDRAQIETDLPKGRKYTFSEESIRVGQYRPFHKSWLYFARELNSCVYRIPKLFPTPHHENLVICVQNCGNKEFSPLITDCIPDLHLNGDSQCFPLYYYENFAPDDLFGGNASGEKPDKFGYVRRDGVSNFILAKARKHYADGKISKKDIFFYVYGLLHSADYRTRFAADLKKELPRLPLVPAKEDFLKFKDAGKKLADLHLNYETAPLPKSIPATGSSNTHVEKMRFDKGLKERDKPQYIRVNDGIRIGPIPASAWDYVVNGKSAIAWVMERYAVTTDAASGIVNDPNLWAREHNDPAYVVNLLRRVIDLSVKSVRIINSLPPLNI